MPAAPLEVDVLDDKGQWRRAALTSVPPEGDGDGDTVEERGAARYLGVFFSFEGVDGNAWDEQDVECRCVTSVIRPCMRVA